MNKVVFLPNKIGKTAAFFEKNLFYIFLILIFLKLKVCAWKILFQMRFLLENKN